MKDDVFIRGSVPMTKSEVRAVTLSKLAMSKENSFLDIGAGTGSVSIEAAMMGATVTAVDQKKEAIDLISQNLQKFNLHSVEVLEGQVPTILLHEEMVTEKKRLFDRIFIGGNGGQIEEIFQYIEDHLVVGGILVANTIALESTSRILELLKKYAYTEIEIVQVAIQCNKSVGNLNMMIAENPVTILKGIKNEK
jgi:cobalt-precorrin-6B (C15)-methyltransferase